MVSESTDAQNLYTAGTGIFETHVTWEDILASVQKGFGTKALFGPNKTIKNVGEGNGFLSRVCLIEPDWQNRGSNEHLPNKFVVKMHNNEVNVFKLFAKYGLFKKLAIPKVYYLQKFTEEEPLKGHIIMEYMDNLETVHIYTNLSVEAVKEPLRFLAVMEAASLRFTDEEKALFKNMPFKQLYGKYYGPDKIDMYVGMIKSFGKGKLDKNCEKIMENIATITDMNLYDSLPEKLGMRKVLCHGDMWSTNILWGKSEGKHKMKAVVDFQTSHFGAPTIDLCRLLITTLSAKDRRENWEHLLETFYGYLKEELKGEEVPYTLNRLKEAYRIYLPMGGFMILPMIGPLTEILNNHADAEERERITQLVFEKTKCLLEDIVKSAVERKL